VQARGRKCSRIKPGGQRCRANALPGGKLCFFHAPDRAGERQRARRVGGKKAHQKAAVLPAQTPDLPLQNAADVTRALAGTVNEVRTGRVDVKVANCIGYLCGLLLKAHEVGELQRRLETLEQRAGGGRK
jgi:hypothetical protein